MSLHKTDVISYVMFLSTDDEANFKCKSFKSFPVAMVISLLAAMRNNSVEARQRFPRLLQIVELYPNTMDTFIKKV